MVKSGTKRSAALRTADCNAASEPECFKAPRSPETLPCKSDITRFLPRYAYCFKLCPPTSHDGHPNRGGCPKNSRGAVGAKENGRPLKSTIRLRTRACFANGTPDGIETTWENPKGRLISRLKHWTATASRE